MLEIMTERCCLRPMTDADFPALCRYLQDPGVMYAYGHAFSDREVWDWLRRQQARYVVPGYGALAVELRETGEMIGQCGITLQDCAGVTPVPLRLMVRRADKLRPEKRRGLPRCSAGVSMPRPGPCRSRKLAICWQRTTGTADMPQNRPVRAWNSLLTYWVCRKSFRASETIIRLLWRWPGAMAWNCADASASIITGRTWNTCSMWPARKAGGCSTEEGPAHGAGWGIFLQGIPEPFRIVPDSICPGFADRRIGQNGNKSCPGGSAR